MNYVVTADFEVVASGVAGFVRAILEHAHNSRTLEPGCLVFDVCQDPQHATAFTLYEVYTDAAAYQQHRDMPSYAEFMSRATPLLVMHGNSLFKTRRVLDRISFEAPDQQS